MSQINNKFIAIKSCWASALVFLFISVFSYANPCDDLYAKVTYSLNHSKKAVTATNLEHQTYYAERAMDALQQSKEYQSACGCSKSEDNVLDAIEALEKASAPKDLNTGKFYTKKSTTFI